MPQLAINVSQMALLLYCLLKDLFFRSKSLLLSKRNGVNGFLRMDFRDREFIKLG